MPGASPAPEGEDSGLPLGPGATSSVRFLLKGAEGKLGKIS